MLPGAPVVVSDALPTYPGPGEDARRIVRHGLRDWVAYIGEDVGPPAGEPTHSFAAFDGSRQGPVRLFVSRQMWQRIKEGKTR